MSRIADVTDTGEKGKNVPFRKVIGVISGYYLRIIVVESSALSAHHHVIKCDKIELTFVSQSCDGHKNCKALETKLKFTFTVRVHSVNLNPEKKSNIFKVCHDNGKEIILNLDKA